MFLKLDLPVYLGVHFCIPIDLQVWNPRMYNIRPGQNTPARPRATFNTFHNGLIPKTPYGVSLHSTYGIYILAFDLPYCHLYVGIAAYGGKHPEGVLTRLKKHRVKATASHVGSKASVCGGVNHTSGWRNFATSRAKSFAVTRRVDCLADARLIIGQIHVGTITPSNIHQSKAKLEEVENAIVSNKNGILDDIRARLWPAGCVAFELITKKVTSRNGACETDIVLWD